MAGPHVACTEGLQSRRRPSRWHATCQRRRSARRFEQQGHHLDHDVAEQEDEIDHRERVEEAFDAFYRHIAQLDSTLRTLESVEVFRRQAGDLRAELRAMRAAGWAPYPRGYTLTPERSLVAAVPDSVGRIALEVLFIIAVAAVVAVADFSPLEIVGVMVAAVAITASG